MGLRYAKRHKFSVLVLAIGVIMTLPTLSFGAAHTFRSSRRVGAFKMHRNQSLSPWLHRFGVFGLGDDSGQEIIIQNISPSPTLPSREAGTNKIYVQPRWVDGGHGVQILQPGYWIEPKQTAPR